MVQPKYHLIRRKTGKLEIITRMKRLHRGRKTSTKLNLIGSHNELQFLKENLQQLSSTSHWLVHLVRLESLSTIQKTKDFTFSSLSSDVSKETLIPGLPDIHGEPIPCNDESCSIVPDSLEKVTNNVPHVMYEIEKYCTSGQGTPSEPFYSSGSEFKVSDEDYESTDTDSEIDKKNTNKRKNKVCRILFEEYEPTSSNLSEVFATGHKPLKSQDPTSETSSELTSKISSELVQVFANPETAVPQDTILALKEGRSSHQISEYSSIPTSETSSELISKISSELVQVFANPESAVLQDSILALKEGRSSSQISEYSSIPPSISSVRIIGTLQNDSSSASTCSDFDSTCELEATFKNKSNDLVPDEGLLMYDGSNVLFKTLMASHKYEMFKKTDGNAAWEMKRTCNQDGECLLETELVITRRCTELENIIALQTCNKPGYYLGKERQIGSGMFVATLRKKPVRSKRKTGKKLSYCLYCHKGLVDLTHHLKRQHALHDRVKGALDFPEKSIERRRAFQKIKNDGNRLYESKSGLDKAIPLRSSKKSEDSEFLRCKGCNGLVISYNYSRHVRRCNDLPANYRHHATEARRIQISNPDVDDIYEELISDLLTPLRTDQEKRLIETDVALRAYAGYYSVSSKTTLNKAKNVRSHLRLLARLLLEIQSLDTSILSLADILTLQKYPLLLLGVMKLVGFNIFTNSLEKTSTPLVLKSCLTNLAKALVFHYKKHSKSVMYTEDIKNIEEFQTHFISKYTEDISKPVYQHKANLKALTKYAIPANEDIAKFASYVERQAEEAYNELCNNVCTYKNYMKLGRSVLIMVLVFNRRRIGETSRMKLQCYQQREVVSAEIEKYMSSIEKHLAQKLVIVKLVGKKLREFAATSLYFSIPKST